MNDDNDVSSPLEVRLLAYAAIVVIALTLWVLA